ncbi:MAG TPA: hypothetical protein VIT91_13705 [Chthoniobacterales bacterium]
MIARRMIVHCDALPVSHANYDTMLVEAAFLNVSRRNDGFQLLVG